MCDTDTGTEYIKCEHCARVFDHDTFEPGHIFCPYCGKEITEASETVVNPNDGQTEESVI